MSRRLAIAGCEGYVTCAEAAVEGGGRVVRVTVPAFPENDATVAGAARLAFAEAAALTFLGYEAPTWFGDFEDDSWGLRIDPTEPGFEPHIAFVYAFEDTIDARYELAVVGVMEGIQ